MRRQKVGIVAECVCDLPKKQLDAYGIMLVYFLIETDHGVFSDTEEIRAVNILDYLQAGGAKSVSSAPSADAYAEIFAEALKKYDEVVHVAISSGISESCANARAAVDTLGGDGGRVHVFDSGHLSTGLGHLVLRAAELAAEGADSEAILDALNGLKARVSTTFIVKDADYLYRNGKVSEAVKKVCSFLRIHPVLAMKNGVLTLKTVYFGNYEQAGVQYLRAQIRRRDNIDFTRVFLTHAGCGSKTLNRLKQEFSARCPEHELTVTQASATVSSNCGPGAFGFLYVDRREKSSKR